MYNHQYLRAMAIYSINDAGFQARHIKFVSGHRCKVSLNTYNRNMTVYQKRNPSYVLSAINNLYHNNTNKSDTYNNLSLILVSVHVLPEIL